METMQTEPDIELIQKVMKGDLVALNTLIEKHKNPVFHFCMKILKHREEAEEVSQDVFIKMYNQISGFKGESKFTTWLYRITYNECISRIRKNKKLMVNQDLQQHDSQLIDLETTFSSLDRTFRNKVIDRALEELDEESRTIVLMYYYHEKRVNEIADIMRFTETNVKTKLFRARKSMLSFMEKKLKLSKNEMLGR